MAAKLDTVAGETNVLERQRYVPYIKVSTSDIDKLVTEIMQIKEFLPKVLNSELLSVYNKLELCEQELEGSEEENRKLKIELEQMRLKYDMDLNLLKKRNNSLLEDCEKCRQEKYELKCQLSDLSQQMGDQSEYCSSMGAAVCTLLWRVSRQQESVVSLLGGNKAEEFLQLSSKTIESYFETYNQDGDKENSDEFQFVLALIGTITNTAAAAQGRDFLVSKDSGRHLIDRLLAVLGACAVGKNVKLRNLILMALYNISINLSGLQYIIKKQNMMGILMRLLQGESDSEIRLNAVRLLQSVVMEPNILTHEAMESISFPVLQDLARTSKGELRDNLLEVLSDLQSYPSQ